MKEDGVLRGYEVVVGQIEDYTKKFTVVTTQLDALINQSNVQSGIHTAVANLQQQAENISQIYSVLPNIVRTNDFPMMELSRTATLAVSSLSSGSALPAMVTNIGTDYLEQYKDYNQKISAFSQTAVDLKKIYDNSTAVSTLIGESKEVELILQTGIVKAAEYSVFAEKSLQSINLIDIGRKLSLAAEVQQTVSSNFLKVSESYSNLFKSFEENPVSYVEVKPNLIHSVPVEYFATANLVEAISVEEETSVVEEQIKVSVCYENEFLLSENLPKLDKGLFKMWKGAIEAYNSDNTDKIRHFAVSLRELFTHVLHSLAPNNEITAWTDDASFFHEGKPTRKARLLYICRNISNAYLSEFIKKDIEATLAFIDVFQEGTHGLDPDFSNSQLAAIKNKAESTLKFILEVQATANA